KRVDHTPDVMIGLLHETGIHFHLPAKHRLHLRIDVVPGGNLFMTFRQFTVFRNDTELLLARESFLAQLVPTPIESSLVLVGPFLWDVMRSVSRAGRVINKERTIRR